MPALFLKAGFCYCMRWKRRECDDLAGGIRLMEANRCLQGLLLGYFKPPHLLHLQNRCHLCYPKATLELIVCANPTAPPGPHICFRKHCWHCLAQTKDMQTAPLWGPIIMLKQRMLREIGSPFCDYRHHPLSSWYTRTGKEIICSRLHRCCCLR